MENVKKGSILAGMIWMAVLSLLLFWMPVVGPFIAGVVGGKKSGGVMGAVVAVFLPSIVFGFLMFVFGTMLSGFPVFGMVAGMGGFALSLVHVGPLLLGAIIGGLLA